MARICFSFLLTAVCILSGCTAITSRSIIAQWVSPPPPLYFGGVRGDYAMIFGSKNGHSEWFDPVYGVVDMPFSLGADILFVPYDVYTDCRYDENSSIHKHREAPSQSQSWPHLLSEEEIARCKQVAWDAASSPEMWKRFKPERLTTEPVKLDKNGIQCYFDQKRFNSIEVAIPSGGRFGWHSCYIGVTVARGTYKVLGMRECYWP